MNHLAHARASPWYGSIRDRWAHNTGLALSDGRVLLLDSEATGLFDPVGGTWSTGVPMIQPRDGATTTLLPTGQVLVAGGFALVPIVDGMAQQALASAELFEPGP